MRVLIFWSIVIILSLGVAFGLSQTMIGYIKMTQSETAEKEKTRKEIIDLTMDVAESRRREEVLGQGLNDLATALIALKNDIRNLDYATDVITSELKDRQ